MKKRKLLCLLTAVLAFAMPFGACEDEKAEVEQATEHEFWQYFVMEEDAKAYSDVYKIEGVSHDYDEKHNLLVVETNDLNNQNVVTTQYTVYDLSQGEAGKSIFTRSVSNLYNVQYEKSLAVNLHYPLIEVEEKYYVSDATMDDPDDRVQECKYSYYLIGADNYKTLVENVEADYSPLSMRTVNNLYVCEIDEKVYWINQDVEVLRTLNKLVIDSSYDQIPLDFDAEYKDYLYSWSKDLENPLTRTIQVFNKEGVCSMQYSYPNVAMLDTPTVAVLNNGNIFVQMQTVVEEDAADYDYKWMGMKIDLVSQIIDYKTGKVTDLDLNFIVNELESQYAGREYSDFALQLKEGKQNQANITYYNESGIANRTKYVVLDNEMKVEYTVKNNALDTTDNHDFEMINKDYYVADTVVNGIEGEYLFNLGGNVMSKVPENTVGITSKYIVTTHAIYDLRMNLVFDVETSMFGSNRGDTYYCEVLGDKIFMYATNYLTGDNEEAYVFDSEKKEPVLLFDNIKTYIEVDDDSKVYYVWDQVNETCALYTPEDKLLLKCQGDIDYIDTDEFEDVLVVEIEEFGKEVIYVLKRA